MFRRKHKDAPAAEENDAALDALDDGAAEQPAGEPGEAPVSDGPAASAAPAAFSAGGPYDAQSPPDDEIPRVDLGALRVPLIDGLEVRLDVDQQTGEPSQLVLADGDSQLQLGAFAAPKTAGIWAQVRAEIAETLAAAGGSAAEAEGRFGIELKARIPTGQPGQYADARFVGVDRPRWFLRGLLSGPAALDPKAAERLEVVMRETVVVRGTDAMPIRDPLPLKLPTDAAAQIEDAPTLEQLDPGPTITETR